ncbi:MAG: Ldh family oxidoreductase [Bacteroidales bacterium]|nr:Ldh family oxidoreductase [Bacteroidales bacterium]
MKYNHKELLSYTTQLFMAMGCSNAHARVVADVLIAAELRGIPSHGLMRVKDYYQMVASGRINVNPKVSVVHQTPSTATVDGDNALGPIAGKESMMLAIEKAKVAGSGWVATRNSNHFGIAAFYSMMALDEDMIGIALTNANPLVAPTNSTDRLLGTNPIAVAIPADKQPPLVADFATTPIARGKLAIKAKQGLNVSHGLVQDKEGNPSTDPSTIEKGGAIVTLGGDIEHGGHKGYCLTALVDIFSSVFSGANFGPFVPPQVAYLPLLEKSVGKGLGHFFGAFRIDAFRPADEFKTSMDQWIETFRGAKPSNPNTKVLVPGDIERGNYEKNIVSGITILPQILNDLNSVARELDIPLLR